MKLVGTYGPWGYIQSAREIAEGIWRIDTPGHGGLKLARAQNAMMPAGARTAGGWYEEDCEWSLVCLRFPGAFTEGQIESAPRLAKDYFPEAYELITGLAVDPSESKTLQERAFRERHKEDFVVTSAQGDWAEGVPSGMVLVHASVGGRGEDGHIKGDEERFLVSESEYRERGPFGFVVDPSRHARFVRP
jgi:hypothetical protein